MAKERENTNGIANESVINCDQLPEVTNIQPMIRIIRGKQVMLDRDLAAIYGVETKRLNEQVKRNIERFPDDFMFQLTKEEFEEWKSQFATSKSITMGARKLPYAFTENGVAMLSSVLRSQTAIDVNISIMRAFVLMRQMSIGYEELLKRIEELEQSTDAQFSEVYQALTQLLSKPEPKPRKPIGYRTYDE